MKKYDLVYLENNSPYRKYGIEKKYSWYNY